MALQLENTDTDSINLPSRKKLLGTAYGMGMNVNNIIGAGIFATPGIVWKQVKSPSIVVLLWTIGGIVSLCGSLIYSELGVIHRESGGETLYLSKAYPRPYQMASYVFSFMFIFIIRPGIICAVLASGAQYAWYAFEGVSPNLTSNGWKSNFEPYWILKLIAIALLLIITSYHMLSNKWANRINHGLTIIKTIMIIIIALSGISKYHNTQNWKKPLESDSESSGLNSYSVAIIEIFFSYNGWNTLNFSLDEFRNPEKRLKLSNTYSVGIVSLLYLMVNVAFITALPQDYIINTNTEDFNETIAADFFLSIFNNRTVARIFSFFVVLSAIGTAATSVWSGSRVIVSAAKSNFFPIFSYELQNWNDYFNTPINALIAQFIWCSFFILIVGSCVEADNFILFTSIAMFSSWIFYIFTSYGLLVTRKRLNYEPKIFLSIITYFFIISGFGIIILSFFFIERSQISYIHNISFILITFISLIVGIFFWFILFYRPHLKDQERREMNNQINTQVRIILAESSKE
ncbi:amino acid/polyamine transporter I [Glomus cerebriforme]|uniref:Amino acid/polyamine transporter I n=1 Tax=Glomus cerebriforme TaxID=658196 RepID=A0A397T1W1_9GLOM|nr:amino acid/polyamine transporter I [Glomus cerebriforme]